jgi:uncharacterized membrane protein YdbT with pleckstrin-like domain
MLSLYRLPGNIKNEQVLKIYRRDFFVLFKKILFFLVLSTFPALLFFLMASNFNELIFSGIISYPLFIIFTSSYYIFIWLFFFFSFIDYYLDVWIITNERIIDIQQKGFFSRIISEQRLYRIQDVTSEVHGFLPTVFRYGNVYVQTAGSKQRFFFNEIPNPENVRDTIIKLIERHKRIHKNEF